MIVLFCAGCAFGIAYAWQSATHPDRLPFSSREEEPQEESPPEEPEEEPASQEPEDDLTFESQVPAGEEEETPSDTLPDGDGSQETPPAETETEDDSSAAYTESPFSAPELASTVPESERADSSYFDDAAFVGDSITNGIKSYGLMNNTTVIANTGLNPSTILTDAKINMGGTYVTALEALGMTQPAKIYVMQGSNGIAWFDLETFVDLYAQLIDSILEQHPDSVVYVQSILPVTQSYSDADNDISNAKIRQYDEAIRQMAIEKGVHYLNVAEALSDETGALPEEASPLDGMHFGPTYYNKWFDYLKTHVAS